MANERTRIYENGKEVGHVDTIGEGLYYNVVQNGRTVEQIIPRAGGKWFDVEVNGKKVREIQTDPRTWNQDAVDASVSAPAAPARGAT